MEISARVDLGERALTDGLKTACVCAVMHVNELCLLNFSYTKLVESISKVWAPAREIGIRWSDFLPIQGLLTHKTIS